MNTFIKIKRDSILRGGKYLIACGVFYAIGIILGVVYFIRRRDDPTFFINVCNYYLKIFNPEVSPLSVFFKRILYNAGYIAIIFSFSFVIFTYPLQLLVVLYRGAIIGSIAGVFISLYGFSGGAIYFLVVLPQNLIVTTGLVIAGTLNYSFIKGPKCFKKEKLKELMINSIIGFAVTFAGAIYELAVLCFFIRPMNFYF